MVITRGTRTKELAKGIKKKERERGDGHLIPRPASFFFFQRFSLDLGNDSP